MNRKTLFSSNKLTSAHRAFTLVELLVCIAAIGVLCALVFPIVKQVSTATQRGKCVSTPYCNLTVTFQNPACV